ncbi:hypothetical protein DFP72DRAFT_926709 [Ephemerocybe angulata]|uniref:Uncharacterized protein n=1 Tax=Ephemerocybe angulata TaxID=980116 RepID=A0A8H6LWZ8_9AGAR|nr:hypothetical protein DFP72DRAFT_926709 [Tulosesus angulatus]
MKVTIPSILLGMLSLSTCASAYLDYNELDTRDSTNSLLVERNAVEVPLQHSLRSFLEAAADVYQRALTDEHPTMVKVTVHVRYKGKPYAERPPSSVLCPKSWDAEEMRSRLVPKLKAKCTLHMGAAHNPAINSLQDNVWTDTLIVLDCN